VDCPIEEYPAIQQSLLDYALSLAGLKAGAGIKVEDLPVSVREVLRGVAPMIAYGEGQSLARLDWVPLEDTVGNDDMEF
jgi:hypothetical protein